MIEQISNAITFYAFYTASGVGKTSLTVTADIYKTTTVTPVVSGASATELGGGLYYYTLASGSTASVGEYIAIFKTSDVTVDTKQLIDKWSIGRAGIENLDSSVAGVWLAGTRTLTEFTTNGNASIPSGADVTLRAYCTNVVSTPGVGDASEFWFTVKQTRGQLDSESILQVSKSGGLLFLNQAAPVSPITARDATLGVVSGNLVLTLSGAMSALLVSRSELLGEIKQKTSGGTITVLSEFVVTIENAITQAV